MIGRILAATLLAAMLGACGVPPPNDSGALGGADVTEHIGTQLPLELGFRDASGAHVRLGDVFHDGRPVVLVLAYYDCSMLCPLVLRGIAARVRESPPDAGAGYRVLTISVDPRDGTEDAAHMKTEILGATPPQGLEWAFWTGDGSDIAMLADRLGFRYRYDEASDEFAHPAVVFVLTEDGKVSRYLYGVDIPRAHFDAALGAAARGDTGSTFERVLQRCFHYVPALRRYASLVSGFFRIGATLVLLSLVSGVFVLTRRVRRREA